MISNAESIRGFINYSESLSCYLLNVINCIACSRKLISWTFILSEIQEQANMLDYLRCYIYFYVNCMHFCTLCGYAIGIIVCFIACIIFIISY